MGAELAEVIVCVTPFAKDGALDLDLVEAHLRRVMGLARRVLVGGSGTEEGFALSPQERRALLATAVRLGEELGVEVRLNGLEPRTPALGIADVRLAREVGAAAIHLPMLDMGHGNRPRPDELADYLRIMLAEVGELDVYISSSMAAGQVFPVDVLERAAEHPAVKGAVVGAPSETYLAEVIRAMPGRIVHVAGTAQLANGLVLGAGGFVSPQGNVAPHVVRSVAASAAADDWPALRRGIRVLMEINEAARPWGLTAGIKAALRGLGLLDSIVRPPRIDVPAEVELKIAPAIGAAIDEWSSMDV